jgi:hypothetical protein
MDVVQRPSRLKDKVLLERDTGATIVLSRVVIDEAGDFKGMMKGPSDQLVPVTVPARTIRRQRLLVGRMK